jgi:molecular chaperone Hsp33
MTDDHGFRVVSCDVTETARRIVEVQGATGGAAQALAELVAATILVRETMSPSLRVQGIAKSGNGLGSLLADSHPDGGTRGLAQMKKLEARREGGQEDFTFGSGAVLQMMRTLPNGALHTGIVNLEGTQSTGGASGLSQALMEYLQESEQVVSVAAVGARFRDGALTAAGGYIVQLLPQAERPTHVIMTQRLVDFPPIADLLDQPGFGAQLLIDELLFGMPYSDLARENVFFECQCSEAALLSALATLGRAEVQSMVDQGEPLDITCDYCHREYHIAIERLRALLEVS